MSSNFLFYCSAHSFPISLNFGMSSRVQRCDKRKHRSMCAVFYVASPHVSIEVAQFLFLFFAESVV